MVDRRIEVPLNNYSPIPRCCSWLRIQLLLGKDRSRVVPLIMCSIVFHDIEISYFTWYRGSCIGLLVKKPSQNDTIISDVTDTVLLYDCIQVWTVDLISQKIDSTKLFNRMRGWFAGHFIVP